jgi:hypothetical protein
MSSISKARFGSSSASRDGIPVGSALAELLNGMRFDSGNVAQRPIGKMNRRLATGFAGHYLTFFSKLRRFPWNAWVRPAMASW